jgi:hypothetical protein
MTMTADVKRLRVTHDDVSAFVQRLGDWAVTLPDSEQSLLYLVLATAAAAPEPDVTEYLAGIPIPESADIIVEATAASSGTQSDAVIAPSKNVVEGRVSRGAAMGAAGGALARALLNRIGEG